MGKLTRRKARENAFLVFFSSFFGNTTIEEAIGAFEEEDSTAELDEFGKNLLDLYAEHAAEIDQIIESKLKGWNVSRLPKVNLAILRLAVAEMRYGAPEMDSVIINEAVELAKRYGDEADYQFINGVLGNVSRENTAQMGREE